MCGVWSDGSQGCGAGCSCVLRCGVFGFVLFLSTASILRYSRIRSFLLAPKKYKDAIVTTDSEDGEKILLLPWRLSFKWAIKGNEAAGISEQDSSWLLEAKHVWQMVGVCKEPSCPVLFTLPESQQW